MPWSRYSASYPSAGQPRSLAQLERALARRHRAGTDAGEHEQALGAASRGPAPPPRRARGPGARTAGDHRSPAPPRPCSGARARVAPRDSSRCTSRRARAPRPRRPRATRGPVAVIETTAAPDSIACARARCAKAVSVVCEMITDSVGLRELGRSTQNVAEERQRASRLSGPNISAPSSAACWLVPVPTSQTRSERSIRSAAVVDRHRQDRLEQVGLRRDRLRQCRHLNPGAYAPPRSGQPHAARRSSAGLRRGPGPGPAMCSARRRSS